jgi:hypothetical protein
MELRDQGFGEDGFIGLIAILTHGWVWDLGSTGWGGYDVENCWKWLRDGGREIGEEESW